MPKQQRRSERAVEDFDRAIKIDPGLAQAYAYRAFARHYLGQVETAKTDASRPRNSPPAS